MTERLRQVINEFLTKEGTTGRVKLALAVERGERMIDRYLTGQSLPSRDKAYKLALACGCSEEEALAIAKECSSERARESA